MPRTQLWKHLHCRAMPALLLHAIREMYEEDKYSLWLLRKDSSKVQQGYPLSSLFSSLFINDICRGVSQGVNGAVMGETERFVWLPCCMLIFGPGDKLLRRDADHAKQITGVC